MDKTEFLGSIGPRSATERASSPLESEEVFLLNLGKRIVTRRGEIAFTQERLALLADISSRHLHDVEKGRQNISILALRRISAALKIPTEQLVAAGEIQAASPSKGQAGRIGILQ